MKKVPLQSLILDFESCQNISDTGLDNLQGGLRRIPSLRKLSLSFSQYEEFVSFWGLTHDRSKKISDSGIISLVEAFKRLPLLKSLDLNFDCCNANPGLTNKGLSTLADSFKKLEALEILKLNLRKCFPITDIGVVKIGENLRYLPLLKEFDLALSKYF